MPALSGSEGPGRHARQELLSGAPRASGVYRLLEAPNFFHRSDKRLDKRLAIGSRFLLQNSSIWEPTMVDRLKTLMHRLTDHTVLADLLDPVSRALARVRQATVGRTLTMPDFIALGVLRHLQGMATLEAKVDDPDGTDRPDWTVPLFRYTAKVSRQVLRFFKHCFLKPASPGLYERELGPMLKAYL